MSKDLTQRTIERRGVEAVIWGMPAVNFDRMYQAMVHDAKAGEGSNKIVYWSRPLSWKNQTLTPNPDTIYLMPFFNTKEVGPMVLEIPPADNGSITGSVDDCWQTAIEDVGPAGVDKGKGGKYLILPPGYKDQVPPDFIPMQSETYEGYALLRSNLKSSSETDVANAVAYGRRIRFYPLSQAAHPPDTQFIDAIDVVFDATIPYDLRFFESLDRIVQIEPWLTRDKVMIDQLKSIGIEKGKPFNPDAATQEHPQSRPFSKPMHGSSLFTKVSSFRLSMKAPTGHLPASPEFAKAIQTNYADPDSYPVDARGLTYSFAFFSAKHLGAGQYYLMTINDKAGKPFDGAATYRLNVPANAARHSVLVRHRLRPQHPRSHSQHANGPAAPRPLQESRRTPMVPWTSTSARRPRRARSPIGSPPIPMESSKCSSASTARRSRSSTRRGSCRISNLSPNETSTTYPNGPAEEMPMERVDTKIGKIELENGYPTSESVAKRYDELDFQRAVQAYIWAIPIVALDSLRIANKRDWGVDYNGVGIVDQFTSPAVLALTGNSTTIYALSCVDLERDGPVVIDSPPGAYGVVDDYWQRPVTEVGAFGPDKGKAENSCWCRPVIRPICRRTTSSLNRLPTGSLSGQGIRKGR